MPSPLAHIGLAWALGGPTSWREAGLVAFAAIAPDFDVLPLLWDPDGLRFHHGPTHSLIGAALIGLSISLFSKRKWSVIAGALLHVPLDWSTGTPGAPLSYGVPLFWPFSVQKYMDPQPWFGAYHIDGPSGLGAMWASEALQVYGKELATVTVAVLLSFFLRRFRREASP